ncbi:interferon alpha/beta receptor 2-like isoform X2 [Heterodontus francisci]|uniref:interferon alpha/beta receptor 2-like isoform X2 n=1 Tax=Heterodontus francisci TaxID=7792 RepID=UPI00355BFCA5
MMFKVTNLLYLHQFLNSVTAVLLPPHNASFTSENLHHVLMWEAGTDAPFTTRYTVEYLPLSTLGTQNCPMIMNQTCDLENQWLAAQNCSLITNRTCDLSDEFTDVFESYFTRVKAVTETDESNWTSLDEFQPFRDTKIRPVNVHLSETPVGVIKIHFNVAAPPLHFSRSLEVESLIEIYARLSYRLAVFKNGKLEKNRDVFRSTKEMSVEEIVENVQPNTNYCITIKMFIYDEDHSDPLERRCIVTQYVKDDKAQTLLIVVCILGICLVGVVIVLCKAGFLGFLSKYGPQALNNLKHVRPVYKCNDVQEKFSTLEHVCFNERKIENIEEDCEEDLMSNDEEAGYEQNSLFIPVQNSAQSSSAFSEVETDEASTMSCDDQLCDSVSDYFSNNHNDSQMATTDIMQNECPDAENVSQTQTIHSRKSSLTSASINISDVALCSIQIQDLDCCFVNFSNERMCDQEAQEPDIAESDDLNDS